MITRPWLKKLFARPPRTIRKAPARFRPRVEGLEERVTPSMFTVTSLADDGSAGTLRQAINLANANPGSDTINFASALAGGNLILGSTELPKITGDLQIDGLSANPDASINLASGSTRLLEIAAGVQVSIADLEFVAGYADNGGA
ncbi:MAG TPA: hypothetical protein VKD72_39640, partial [Gemmataceae bacterium]|nr:hypothetical protein [Gemmataceae bacterium]